MTNTISEEDRARVHALPVGPNAKQTILLLMRQGFDLDEALLELSNLAADDRMAEVWWRAANRANRTGVRA